MSRISYQEDEDWPGQFNLWRANVNRSIAGKRGQAALRDLEAALLAMPNKRLIGHKFIDGEEVCAVGALVIARLAAKGKPEAEVKTQLNAEHTYCRTKNCDHRLVDHRDGPCSACARDRAKTVAFWVDYYLRYPDSVPNCQSFTAPSPDEDRDEYDRYDDIEGETEGEAVKVGVPEKVAWRLVELNDFELDRDTPEERYEHVLKWVQRRLKMTLDEQQRQDMV